jgi:hypothetical protein
MDKVRVLVRFRYTNAFLAAPQAEREKLWEEMGRSTEKWTNAGAKMLSAWVSAGYVDGFDHYVIWDMPGVDTVQQMRNDWFEAATAHYIDADYHIGWAPPWDPALQ